MEDWRKQNLDSADYYGYEAQSNQLIEEIADVELMLAQIKYLLGINPKYVVQIKIEKVNRTKENIAREMI